MKKIYLQEKKLNLHMKTIHLNIIVSFLSFFSHLKHRENVFAIWSAIWSNFVFLQALTIRTMHKTSFKNNSL